MIQVLLIPIILSSNITTNVTLMDTEVKQQNHQIQECLQINGTMIRMSVLVQLRVPKIVVARIVRTQGVEAIRKVGVDLDQGPGQESGSTADPRVIPIRSRAQDPVLSLVARRKVEKVDQGSIRTVQIAVMDLARRKNAMEMTRMYQTLQQTGLI